MARSSLKNVARLLDLETSEPLKRSDNIELQFLHDFKRAIEMDSVSDGKLPSQTFKPSSMQCRRNSYYQLIGQEPDYSESSYNMSGILQSGSDIHLWVQHSIDLMEKNGMPCQYIDIGDYVKEKRLPNIEVKGKRGMETKLYNNKYNISFMCDGLVSYKGKYYIIEIKTETSNKWYARNGVDTKHHNQAIAYSLSLRLDNVIFLYVSRDMLDVKSYMFEVDDKMRAGLVKYITTVNDYVKKKIAPPRDNEDRRVCQYCGYKSACRRDK